MSISNEMLIAFGILVLLYIFAFLVEIILYNIRVNKQIETIKASNEYQNILSSINNGQYVYSASKIPIEAKGYAAKIVFENSKRFKILVVLYFVLFSPVLFSGEVTNFLYSMVIWAVMCAPLYVTKANAEKYETHLAAIKNLTRQNERSNASSSSSIEEISKLKELFDNGVLSQAEFDQAKAALLRNIA